MQVLLRRALRMRGRAQVKPRYRPRPEERGVAMVEFAVILPVLAMLVVGVVEIGFAFKEKLLVDNAIQVAARTGSVLDQSDDVDLRILKALEQGFVSLPGNGDGVVLQAQVYCVNTDGTTDPTKVNTYLFAYNPSPAICNWNPCPATPAQHGVWQPAARDATLDGGLDSIGVTVFYGHDWLLGSQFFLGGRRRVQAPLQALPA
jgi:Flp pilus assembly protein TadG